MDKALNPDIPLHASEAQAIANIRAQALALKPAATDLLAYICRMSNIPETRLNAAIAAVRRHARIALHFHPDRPANGGDTVSRALLRDGVYRSQFETGISNGSVSAHPGGARDEWERALFDGAYHGPSPYGIASGPQHRPKYGALDLMHAADGPAIRFGSCFFLLHPVVGTRATFTFGDSQHLPRYRATGDVPEPVLVALFEECFQRDFALGVGGIRPPALLERLLGLETQTAGGEQYGGLRSRNLDHCIEAQVHGEVRLDRDIAALVADPSFKGRETGAELEAMSMRYGFPLWWHAGFRAKVVDVPPDFRGPTMPSLAMRVARDGVVDAEAIGRAVRDVFANPELWKDRGTLAQIVQELKLLWHVVVRYGDVIESHQQDQTDSQIAN